MEKELYQEMASLEEHHWWFRGRQAVILDMLTRAFTPRSRILDIGVGTGSNAQALLERGFRVEGIEPSEEAIHFAHARVPTLPILKSLFPSAEIPREAYDGIVLLDVLEHFDNDREALAAVRDALVPGGRVLITVPAFTFLWTGHDDLAHHKRRYRRGELIARLREAGLKPIEVSYYNFFLFPPIALVRLVQKALRVKKHESDFSSTPGFLNGPFAFLFGFERFLLRYTTLPWGVSIIAVAEKEKLL